MTGLAIASYNESETEWVDRTLVLEIPQNSVSNETWDVVVSESHGESGGSRKWDFQYMPEEQSKATILNYPFDIYHVVGASAFKESLNGFYSDSYKGEESCRETQVDNKPVYVWDLVSGSGGGNGENKFSNKNSLTGTLTFPNIDYVYDTPGYYTSSREETNAETFTTVFTVANGAWQRELTHKDKNTLRERYDFSAAGIYAPIGYNPLGTDYEREERGKLDKTVTTTEEWRPGALIHLPGGSEVLRDWISYEQDITTSKMDYNYYLYGNKITSLTMTLYDQEYTRTDHKEGVSPSTATESFTIEGTSSGKFDTISSPTYDFKEYRNGRIYRDANTNTIAGMSEARRDSSYPGGPVDPTRNHDWVPIDYNGFTDFRYGVNFGSKGVIYSFGTFLWHDNFTSYSCSVTLDYNGNGVGVAFPGCTTDRESEIFDSGVDKYLIDPGPWVYEPMDVLGYAVGDPIVITGLMENVNIPKNPL